jgi:RHS repeat-associated protein
MVATAPSAPSTPADPPAQGGSASRSASDRRSLIRVAPENDVFRRLEHWHLDRGVAASCIGPARPHRADSHRGQCRFSDQTRAGRYCRARYYHPGLQRFISEDPIGFAGGDVNLYSYVGNSPLSFIDPFGLDKEKKCEDPFPPGLQWLKWYLTAEKTLTPFLIGSASITAGAVVTTGGIIATGAVVAAAPATYGTSLILLPGTLLVVGGGEYLIAFGTDVNIGQINALPGAKIPRPRDIAPNAFPGLPNAKFCK